jgi:mono/diheme cytochrome c family protein
MMRPATKRRWPGAVAALCGLLAASLCQAGAQGEARAVAGDWSAPSEAAAKINPLAGEINAAAGGRKLFLRECSECHCADAAGTHRAPSLRSAGVAQRSDGELFWKITNGNRARKMPSFSRLPELQRWQIVSYLRTLPAPDAPAPAAPKP